MRTKRLQFDRMTFRKSRVAVAVACLILPLGLVSCGGDSDESDEPTTETTVEETVEETADLTQDPSYDWCNGMIEAVIELADVLGDSFTPQSPAVLTIIDQGVKQGDITNQEACDAGIEEAFR